MGNQDNPEANGFTEEEFAAAEAAGRADKARGDRAAYARFNSRTQCLMVGLKNGAALTIPVALIEGLADAPDSVRSRLEISPTGYGLHWPDLDLDLSVPGLLSGVFGTRAWMDRQRAARAGGITSPAKAAAARANGAKGGRPRKSVP